MNVPVTADSDRRLANGETRVDGASKGATSSLDLRPAKAAAVVLMAYFSELASENG